MEYIVSAEKSPFHQWQLELLIESFKVNNCQDDLLVCLSETELPIHPAFWRNISKHPRVFAHENIGSSRGYKGLNFVYDVLWAIKNKLIKQPFCHVPTDMVLKTIPNFKFIEKNPEIVFSPSPFFTFELAETNVESFWEVTNKTKEYYETNWMPLGPIVAYNNIPDIVFERSFILAERLVLKQILNNKPIWKDTVKLALAINLSDFIGKIRFRGNFDLVMNMLQVGNAPFIHYEHGMPPTFNKSMFLYNPPNFASFGDPLVVLSQNSPTENAHFLSKLAQNSISSRRK